MKKRITALCTILCLAGAVYGCGASNATETAPTENSQSDTNKVSEEAPAPVDSTDSTDTQEPKPAIDATTTGGISQGVYAAKMTLKGGDDISSITDALPSLGEYTIQNTTVSAEEPYSVMIDYKQNNNAATTDQYIIMKNIVYCFAAMDNVDAVTVSSYAADSDESEWSIGMDRSTMERYLGVTISDYTSSPEKLDELTAIVDTPEFQQSYESEIDANEGIVLDQEAE